MKRKFKQGLLFFSALLIITSCENNQEKVIKTSNREKSSKENVQDANFVTKEQAITFANSLSFANENSKVLKKEVSDLKEVKLKKNNQSSLYVITYKNNGFVILSADKRVNPILAISNDSKFPLNDTNLPSGLIDWMNSISDYVENVRNEESEISSKKIDKNSNSKIKYQWDNPTCYENNLLTGAEKPKEKISPRSEPEIDTNPETNCPEYSEIVNPLMKTTWGQGYLYNNYTPNLGCNNTNGRAPTGCIATAMAQIMKYYNYPTKYNWAMMPNSYGSDYTAQLMAEIGTATKMNYTCNASGTTIDNAGSAFRDYFGYKNSIQLINYSGTSNYNLVKSELKSGNLVMLSGGRKKDGLTWPWSDYTDGHAWVCDGYSYYSNCYTSTLYLFMNWGWDGAYNGSYAFSNFNPSSYSFNYGSKAIVGIRKQ